MKLITTLPLKGLLMLDMDISTKISRFWDKYTEKTIAYGIRDNSVQWYVRNAEQYIRAHSERLHSHTAKTLDKYLQAKGRNIYIKD